MVAIKSRRENFIQDLTLRAAKQNSTASDTAISVHVGLLGGNGEPTALAEVQYVGGANP